jgi:hypothetical protein
MKSVISQIAKLAATCGLLIVLTCAIWPSTARAARTGIQAIGLSNWTPDNVQKLSNDYVAVGGDLELTFLPFEFNRNHPFDTATTFVQSTLPSLNGDLKVTVYLWFHDADFNWGAFDSGRLTSGEKEFRKNYLRRVDAFDAWVKKQTDWAKQNNVSHKLHFVLSPYLEDDCPNSESYDRLLDAIRAQQKSDVVRTNFRRSPGKNNIFRPDNVPLELHGRYDNDKVKRTLKSGDVFSNDGNFVWLDKAVSGSDETAGSYATNDTATSFTLFLSQQRQALGKGVTVLLWRPVYNGLPRYDRRNDPSANRRNLDPLTALRQTFTHGSTTYTSQDGAIENTAVSMALSAR